MAYKVEVHVGDEWSSNALTFPTKEMAETYAAGLAWRWTSVKEWRVVEAKGE